MRTFEEKRQESIRRLSGPVRVRAPHGLSATVARAVVEEARRHRASATLTAEAGRGQRADGRSVLELLLLEAARDEAITLECVGDDAQAAFEGIAAVLGHAHEGDLGTEEATR